MAKLGQHKRKPFANDIRHAPRSSPPGLFDGFILPLLQLNLRLYHDIIIAYLAIMSICSLIPDSPPNFFSAFRISNFQTRPPTPVPWLQATDSRPPSPPLQHSPNIVMVPNFKEDQLTLLFLNFEKHPQAESRTAFKQIRAKFSDPCPLVGVRKSPCWQHGHQCLVHRRSFRWRKLADLAETTLRQLNPPGDLRCFR